MLSLGIRKIMILSLVGGIFLLGNIWLVVNLLDNNGIIDWARYVRSEYLTGTAITIIIAVPTLIASFWGMNVPVPFQRSSIGFAVMTGLSLLFAGLTVYILWRKKML